MANRAETSHMPHLEDWYPAGRGYKTRGSWDAGKTGPPSFHVILGPVSGHMMSPAGKLDF